MPCLPRPPSSPSQAAEADLLRISNKVRFILAVVGGRLKLSNRRKADIVAELEAEGYDKLPTQKKAQQQVGRVFSVGREALDTGRAPQGGILGARGQAGTYLRLWACANTAPPNAACAEPDCCPSRSLPPQAAADEEEGEVAGASYDYLLSMSLASLTLEKVEALKKVRWPGCRSGVLLEMPMPSGSMGQAFQLQTSLPSFVPAYAQPL